ncbi:MAG: hypothetical protein NUW37_08725 [Planctomycetes bacterium]|nr:hypothetical protein [Planctomycetota bacterium]
MNSPAEFDVLRGSASLTPLSELGTIVVTGADRADFLARVLPGDVKAQKTGTMLYTFLLTSKGKILSDLWISKMPETVVIHTFAGTKEIVREQLSKYTVVSDATLKDESDVYFNALLYGERAESVLSDLGFDPIGTSEIVTAAADGVEIWVRRGFWFDGAYLLTVRTEHADRLRAAFTAKGATIRDFGDLERFRICEGVPRFEKDLINDVIPNETNVFTKAVSLTKGCFIGQEIVARIHYRGHTNRQLVKLVVSGEASFDTPAQIVDREGKKAGIVTSVADYPGAEDRPALGFIAREHLEGKSELFVVTPSGKATITLAP